MREKDEEWREKDEGWREMEEVGEVGDFLGWWELRWLLLLLLFLGNSGGNGNEDGYFYIFLGIMGL